MSQRKASVRRASPTGSLLTGETGGLTLLHPPLPPLIKQKSAIAPTGAKPRIATSSGHRPTGTGEEARLRLNMVRVTGAYVSVFARK